MSNNIYISRKDAKAQKCLREIDVEGLISVLERINRAISDRDYFIGISYFLTENLAEDIENIWCLEIETYLEKYFYNGIDRVDEFRWENIKEEIINI